MPGMLPFLTQPPVELPCCQLLAGLNALRYFGHITPVPGCPIFEYLVDLAGCRHEGATNIEAAWWDLGLVWKKGPASVDWILWYLAKGFPVAISSYHEEHGGHMGLAINGRDDWLYVANWYRGQEVSMVNYSDLTMHDSQRQSYAFGVARGK